MVVEVYVGTSKESPERSIFKEEASQLGPSASELPEFSRQRHMASSTNSQHDPREQKQTQCQDSFFYRLLSPLEQLPIIQSQLWPLTKASTRLPQRILYNRVKPRHHVSIRRP